MTRRPNGTSTRSKLEFPVTLALCLLAVCPAEAIGDPAPAEEDCRATPSLAATLSNPHSNPGDAFGPAAVWDNLVLTGAPQADPGGVSNAGIAYVFDASTGAMISTLHNPSPLPEERFGTWLALSGSLAAAGVPLDHPGGVEDAGTVHIFNALTGEPIRDIENPDPGANDGFGVSVALEGRRLVAGAFMDSPSGGPGGAEQPGRVFVFDAPTGRLERILNFPGSGGIPKFGSSVAVSGNLAVVLADGADTTVEGGGAAYVFNLDTGALVATMASPLPVPFTMSFSRVAISGGIAAAGARGYTAGGVMGIGMIHVFDALTGVLLRSIPNPDPQESAGFGASLGLSGTRLFAGALGYDAPGAEDAGRFYEFDAATGALKAIFENPDPDANDFFSFRAVAGGMIVAGAAGEDVSGVVDAGIIRLYGCIPSFPRPSHILLRLLGRWPDDPAVDANGDGAVDLADWLALRLREP